MEHKVIQTTVRSAARFRSFLPHSWIASGFCLLFAALSLMVQQPCAAVPLSSYSQAIVDFHAKRYSQALTGFQDTIKTNPTDPMLHYYVALCDGYLNQVDSAIKEYKWVVTNCHDPKISAQAKLGLAQAERYKASTGWHQSASPAFSDSAKQDNSVKFASGKMSVIEFNTSWCHVCKRFDPVFDEVKSSSKYSSNCKFQRFDAEDPKNIQLVEKYSVRGYPTVIFADSKGDQIHRFSGGTDSNGFCRMIDQSLAQLPK